MKEYMENAEGVHLMNALNGEYTLCGDAFDAHISESDWPNGEMVATTKRVVTCERCCRIIEMCRGVRCRPSTSKTQEERNQGLNQHSLGIPGSECATD